MDVILLILIACAINEIIALIGAFSLFFLDSLDFFFWKNCFTGIIAMI